MQYLKNIQKKASEITAEEITKNRPKEEIVYEKEIPIGVLTEDEGRLYVLYNLILNGVEKETEAHNELHQIMEMEVEPSVCKKLHERLNKMLSEAQLIKTIFRKSVEKRLIKDGVTVTPILAVRKDWHVIAMSDLPSVVDSVLREDGEKRTLIDVLLEKLDGTTQEDIDTAEMCLSNIQDDDNVIGTLNDDEKRIFTLTKNSIKNSLQKLEEQHEYLTEEEKVKLISEVEELQIMQTILNYSVTERLEINGKHATEIKKGWKIVLLPSEEPEHSLVIIGSTFFMN